MNKNIIDTDLFKFFETVLETDEFYIIKKILEDKSEEIILEEILNEYNKDKDSSLNKKEESDD